MNVSALSALGRLRHERAGDCYLLWFERCGLRPRLDWFDPRWLGRHGLLAGEATGRGTTHYLALNGRRLVLRHYRRGGVLRGLLHDRYPWPGLRGTRPWRELAAQGRLYALGLPVPLPVAARIHRPRALVPLYRADLLTERLADTRTLAEALAAPAPATIPWPAIGAVIRQFHEAGFEHADLNAHNILLDPRGRVYLIDFDRGRFRRRPGRWCRRNLARLRRSLAKLAGRDGRSGFDAAGWRALLAGYAETPGLARASSSSGASASR